MRELVRDALLDALAVIAPVECAGCGAPDRALCTRCTALLRPDVRRFELRDGTPVFAALDYDGEARSVILAFKEQSRPRLARALAPAFAAADAAAGSGVRIAVPTSAAAFRLRGFDPVRKLARAAHVPALSALRASAIQAQKTLGVHARARSREGTMRVIRDLGGERVVLLDDVLTTGATLAEAARAVREAGGTVVAAATVARTRRRLGESSVFAR